MDQLNNFTIAFDRLLSGKRDDNSVYLNNQKYGEIVEIVKTAKSADKKSVLMCRRLKRFDIVRVGNEDRLITPPIVNAGNDAEFTYYVKNDEMYDVLHTTHLDIGHGGKHRMFAEAKKRYKNVTQEIIKIYLTCCVSCRSKAKCARSSCEAVATILPETNGRCRVDLIDMQSQPDGPYRFIMIYEDCSTKFVQLRPLTSQSAGEVARHVLDIFCTFGAPSILQPDSSGGEEFADRVINELGTAWPTLKIVRGKSRHGHHQGRAIVEMPSQDVRTMLAAWMKNEKVMTWSEGLRFVQLTRNGQLRKGMRRSPYRAMFGCDVKFGLATSSAVPNDVINTLTSEEDLETFLAARDEPHRVQGNIWQVVICDSLYYID